MSDYRRYFVPGGTYFFTLVTHKRRRFLTSTVARHCLREAICTVQTKWPFELFAIVLLPDHLHAVISLPPGDDRYTLRWQKIKECFTRSYSAQGGIEATRSMSRRKRQERGYWQRRFWEHTVTDLDDLKNCVDYLHFNPVKHGLVIRVADYPWSTFHKFVRLGEYPRTWGRTDPCNGFEMPE